MYNNNETPIVYEEANSSKELNGHNDRSKALHYENGVWRPATDAEYEEMQKKLEEIRKTSEVLNKKISERRRILRGYRY